MNSALAVIHAAANILRYRSKVRGHGLRRGLTLWLAFTLLASPAVGEEVLVEVLLSSDSSIYEEGLAGFQSVVHGQTRVRYLEVLQAEQSDLSAYFNEIESSGAVVYVAFGRAATQLAAENLRSVNVVFSMLNSPKQLNLKQGNLCGVSMDIGPDRYFATLKEVQPSARHVYSFYSTDQGRAAATAGEYMDLQHGLLLESISVGPADSFENALERIKGRADAIYMVPDPLYDRENFQLLSDFSRKHGIVLMTGYPALVRLGATFGISPDYTNLGIATGEMVNRILSGQSNCSNELVQVPRQTAFTLNEEYAKSQGLEISQPIRERARLAGLMKLGVELFGEDKLNSAQKIFEAILKKDPENRGARSYRSLIVERLTGDETRRYMNRADSHMKSRQYLQARAEYARVLQLNPDFEPARKGLAEASRLQSEVETNQARALTNAGQPFAAIRSYISAVRIWPQNGRAHNELAQLRARESAKVPRYMQEGLNQYNRRNYQNAIQMFENVLLVNPGHKEATEYLRLSHQKYAAVQRLLNRKSN
ncbi:MAG: tetratricopeptide repeat protein [Leptospiraceae bacterium]|nr:tetratricopeptide repeat protein [Leptospiraceae bacterium]